ncbi:hypothetical protein C463_07357 [Halorubrum californiense DSM 19288]|uniref:Uncharacterized protein n=1 Tax=Halorubrum californiense DSM 19288 TaxID=1227465 RepID=M0EE93_9EURY|nr:MULTISPECIES: hypothetical protein [Halorubrum]ELZ44754.1 hypothetical protein C463_07357 [Halorubrum californiense DSM 19288]TKX71791.1 hypothetical protein EXE40_06900 [Halorubrum sp. GN11GM_10-3_MGM]
MTRSSKTRVRALALALLLVAASLGAGTVAGQTAASKTVAPASVDEGATGPATAGPGVDANRSEVPPITRCFTGTGYRISIGDGGDDGEGGATMETVIHLSVLTDPGAGNEFGIETAGRLDGEPIVTLGAGVRLTARKAIADGLDPFAAFDVLYTYEFQLPMFAGAVGDADYEDDGSPIDSSAGAVDC